MCSCDDATAPDFYEESWPRARKNYRCMECGAVIPAGHRYQRIVGKWEGDVSTHRMCGDCSAWSHALRQAQRQAHEQDVDAYEADPNRFLRERGPLVEPCFAPMGDLWSCIGEFIEERFGFHGAVREWNAATEAWP